MKLVFAWGVAAAVLVAACGGGDSGGNLIDTDAGSTTGGDDAGANPGADGAIQGAPTAAISATSIDFGPTDCAGSAPADHSVVLANNAGGSITWSASIAPSSFFSIAGTSSGTLGGGASATISVHAGGIPASAHAGDVTSATLTITTNDKAHPTFTVPVSITARGAKIVVTPATVHFDEAMLGATPQSLPIAISNQGNGPAQVGFGAPSSSVFTYTWQGAPAGVTLAAGASLQGSTGTFGPLAIGPAQATVSIQATGAVCADSAASFTLTGSGSPITLTDTTLDYGVVSCGTEAPMKTVTVKNGGASSVGFSVVLDLGSASPYTVSPSTGTLAATTGQQILTVTPKKITPPASIANNAFGDTLTITTTGGDQYQYRVSLLESAKGAIITASVPSVDFQRVQLFAGEFASNVKLTNTGNAPAALTLSSSASAFSVSPSTVTSLAAGGGNQTLTTGFSPVALGPQTSTLTLKSTDSLCMALPSISFAGYGYAIASQVSGGDAFSCALLSDGHVACWGSDAQAQMGIGNNDPAPTPVVVHNLSDATEIALGAEHACAVRSNKTVACWGYNYEGEIGNGLDGQSAASGDADAYTPAFLSAPTNVTHVAAGADFTCAIDGDGAAWCWGANTVGQNGSNAAVADHIDTAQKVANYTDFTAIAAGGQHACGIRPGGAVACWGSNASGELGTGVAGNAFAPAVATGLANAVAIGAGTSHTCVALSGGGGGGVQCWGSNSDGQIADGNQAGSGSAITVAGISNAKTVALGSNHTCVLLQTGAVSCFGANASGQLGDSSNSPSSTPVGVTGITSAIFLGAGGRHGCVVKSGGAVACWGEDGSNQLGDGLGGAENAPVPTVGF